MTYQPTPDICASPTEYITATKNEAVSNTKAVVLNDSKTKRIDWKRTWPFFALHLVAISALWTDFSLFAVWICLASYLVRMFAITGFYHRYFSHRTFKTSRAVQFVFALIGTTATQRGPLWWAANHRHHHRHADTGKDKHSPLQGFWQSHCGWFLSKQGFETPRHLIKDFGKYPELLWLDRYDLVVAVVYGLSFYGLGEYLAHAAPELGTNGWQLFLWGYVISTLMLTHVTLSINSLAHRFGSRRYPTRDHSRNNGILALLTLGEGWHNNHHFYCGSARQGFFWWEIDITYYGLKLMAALGLVRDLRPVPAHKRDAMLNPQHQSRGEQA